MNKLIAFDCDSTLSAIEGVDELARLAGNDVFRQVEDLTNQAMNGEIPIEEIFARRLELINPTRQQCIEIGKAYLKEIEPTAKETISKLKKEGWECIIISGGFVTCIEELAEYLEISSIEAVPLYFNENGDYRGFDNDYPTTRNGGKPELLEQAAKKHSAEHVVMVGDGISDLETFGIADKFVGFTRYAARPQILEKSPHIASELSQILDIIKDG
jgi:phosphoserine phosphatase